ncbi:DUF5703 domain-containing protein [Paraflavitalea sp. CAU 1676]|uniref:DUF5703 domain-containing protein n=1 Tax=Paraflavitalea sp. CAU 1676 TaxID=3032598 RepID=UPI0023DA2B85|nr:DUF5703 domain-containing protein [Paraflavitalea sp. CAU 1676]MDF2190455.1 DUF5703 domain-containing protein [Paraflavitalea sp. CAU 1676]
MKQTCILFLLTGVMGFFVKAQNANLSAYNIVWTSPSNNASESMPCGGGDIGLNVWVEKGELLIYASRSGSFDENNSLLKAGRIRLQLSPNIFTGTDFKQELHLQEGYITVEGSAGSQKGTVRIWVDVYHPVVHIAIYSNKKIAATATYESWRYRDRPLTGRVNWGTSWKWAAPKNNIAPKDSIAFTGPDVLFYHRNQATTVFDATVAVQGMDSVKDQLYNPLFNLQSGGSFSGGGFTPAGTTAGVYAGTDYKGWVLKSDRPAIKHALTLQLHTASTSSNAQWRQGLDSLHAITRGVKMAAFQQTQSWWTSFWQRSYVQIDPERRDPRSWEIGRNYQLFRYMLALNATGSWPTKFNGGLLTVDPVYTDTALSFTPDFRNWGGGLHTMQNQRLVYYPMIKNGDWDMLQSQLDFYTRILHNAELRSKVYWGHAGACFTEQMESFGLPNIAEYGQKRPAGFDKGVEFNPWLEYEWDTVLEFCLMMLDAQRYTGKDIKEYVPFIESCLRFFDEHYQYRARLRGSKALDGAGKLVLYPGSAAETFKMAYNASSTAAGLRVITERLLQLPANYGTPDQRVYWQGLLQRIPPISFMQYSAYTTIAPAKLWERVNNVESPQLYPVYPWGLFGVGKPGLDTAINTWRYDTFALKFRSHIGWKQDNIFAARLGLREEAWQLTSLKLQNAGRRFPAFWGPGYDWVPDHNWGGSGLIGVQEMLMQVDDRKILLFPAWPQQQDVRFKLHAPYNTTVEAELRAGKLVSLKVLPESRRQDVLVMLTP